MNKVYSVNDDDFRKIVLESQSYRQIALKLGYSDSGGICKQVIQKRIEELNISTDHFLKHTGGGNKKPDSEVFKLNSKVGQNTLRRRYKTGNYTPYICSICGLEPFWNGKEMILILDHIDGNHHNNVLNNLRWVCSNCNSQLDTFSGRKRVS